MKTRKILALALCAVMLVAASVLGTMAYMTDVTDTVENTFTVGNVHFNEELNGGLDEADVDADGVVKLDENKQPLTRVTENTYKLVPAHTYVKDPTVHLDDESEKCYVFVKVVNEIEDIETTLTTGDHVTIAAQMANLGWEAVESGSNIYFYNGQLSVNAVVDPSVNQDLVVFNEFTIDGTVENDELVDYANAKITIKAYAVQADGFTSVADAWEKAPCTFGENAPVVPTNPVPENGESENEETGNEEVTD